MKNKTGRAMAIGVAASLFAMAVAAVPLSQAWAGSSQNTKVTNAQPNSRPTDKPTPPVRNSWNNGKKP